MEAGGIRARIAEDSIVLAAEGSAILELEDFIDGLDFLQPSERSRLKLASDEIFDNILRYSAPLVDGRIALRVCRRPPSSGALAAFFFRAAQGDKELMKKAAEPAQPLFDPEARRWRGMGLLMCRNLGCRVSFRPGEKLDRIFIRL